MNQDKEYTLIGSLFGVELFIKEGVRELDVKRIKKELSKNKYFTNVKQRKEKKEE